jgi:hypothetical protein
MQIPFVSDYPQASHWHVRLEDELTGDIMVQGNGESRRNRFL